MSNSSTETVMDAETLEALRGSIAKWQAIVDGTGEDKGPDNCPLCLKFNAFVNKDVKSGCHGCPVRERTGESGCGGTPYEDYEEFAFDVSEGIEDEDPEKLQQLAQEELHFLMSLLPKEGAVSPLSAEQEVSMLLIKRTGIDKRFEVAPYDIKSEAQAQRIVAYLQKAWGIPFEWRVV